MGQDSPNYYAVIPADVRYADISANAKLLFGEISALCNQEGFCWATNTYFAKLYKTTERTIQRWLQELAKNEFIDVRLTQEGRRIYMLGVTKMSGGDDKNVTPPHDKNVTHNNTVTNITSNTPPTPSQSEAVRVIEIYAETFHTKLKPLPRRLTEISKRIKESGLEDVEAAIRGAASDEFFNGGGPRGWVGDIDYLMRDSRIIEKYAKLGASDAVLTLDGDLNL